jgi:hypothetical protein
MKSHPMEFAEKELYHQIHPAKLAVDIGATPFALYCFWLHEFIPALIITLVPSVIVSALIMRYVDLEPYRDSGPGRYLKKYMTRAMEGVRFGGLFIMIAGAWFHLWALLPVGILVVLSGWLRGVFFPER